MNDISASLQNIITGNVYAYNYLQYLLRSCHDSCDHVCFARQNSTITMQRPAPAIGQYFYS